MSQRKTRPAKEEDLIVPNGNHAMNPGDGTPYEPARHWLTGFLQKQESMRLEDTVSEFELSLTMPMMNWDQDFKRSTS